MLHQLADPLLEALRVGVCLKLACGFLEFFQLVLCPCDVSYIMGLQTAQSPLAKLVKQKPVPVPVPVPERPED